MQDLSRPTFGLRLADSPQTSQIRCSKCCSPALWSAASVCWSDLGHPALLLVIEETVGHSSGHRTHWLYSSAGIVLFVVAAWKVALAHAEEITVHARRADALSALRGRTVYAGADRLGVEPGQLPIKPARNIFRFKSKPRRLGRRAG